MNFESRIINAGLPDTDRDGLSNNGGVLHITAGRQKTNCVAPIPNRESRRKTSEADTDDRNQMCEL